MNISIEQFVFGFECSVREIKSVLNEWNDLDEELKEQYKDQLYWMLGERHNVIQEARAHSYRTNEMYCKVGKGCSWPYNMRHGDLWSH